MSKFFIAFCFTFFIFNSIAQAQLKLIAESKSFDEPSDDCGILQLKNGNTIFCSFDKKAGISIRIYDKSHTEKAANSFEPAEDLKKARFKTMFEVNNDAVIFISCFNDKVPTLMRYIIDGNTGTKKEEKKIIQLEGKGVPDDDEFTAFTIKNDPVSGNYAVSAISFREDADNKRLQIIQYNASNTEIKKTWLLTNDDKDYKFFVLINMTVINADQLKVFLYNGKEKYYSNTKPGRLVMASVNSKSEAPVYTNIPLPEGIKFDKCFADYSAALKKLFVVVAEPVTPADPIQQYYLQIDPENNKIDYQKFTSISTDMNNKFKERYSTKGNYTGTIQQFSLNDDGSFTVAYEDRFNYSYQSGSQVYSTGYTGKIMVASYNARAEKKSEYFIPKLYLRTGSPYKDFLLVNSSKSLYMCINDTRRNNNPVKGNLAEVGGIGDCDAFYYRLHGNDNFPGRDYILGDHDKSRMLLAFRYVDYNRAENILATMKLTIKPGEPKQCSVVWLQPQ